VPSTGILRSVGYYLHTDVSGPPIGPILKGRAVQEECLILCILRGQLDS